MPLKTALKTFGIASVPADAAELKRLYKNLAMKNHPDLGGSVEKMKELNLANEVLKANLGTGSKGGFSASKFDWDAARKKEMNIKAGVAKKMTEFFKGFDWKAYKSYFEKIFGKKFNVSIVRSDPAEYNNGCIQAPYIKFRAEADDGNGIFTLTLTTSLDTAYFSILSGKGLSASGVTFMYWVQSDAFIDSKKQVIVKNAQQKSSDSRPLTDPESVFPLQRMKKLASGAVRKDSPLKKRDFDSLFTVKWGAKRLTSGSHVSWVVPLWTDRNGIEHSIEVSRVTLMRSGFYSFSSHFYHLDMNSKYKIHNVDKSGPVIDSTYLPECKKVFDAFDAILVYAKKAKDEKMIANYILKATAEWRLS